MEMKSGGRFLFEKIIFINNREILKIGSDLFVKLKKEMEILVSIFMVIDWRLKK